jgi:hypothetical protein
MSNRWPGGLIRKTPVTPAGPLQNGAAPGMWTLAEASFWTKQGLWPIAGNVLVVEDVFSTWLYTGNSSTQTITNGVDLAGKGGLVWTKARSSGFSNGLVDTVRGALNTLISNSTDGSTPSFNTVTAFTSSGFSVGTSAITNSVGTTYVSWTFREAPNFFDVVTYTGTGANRTIAHNLGVAPGMILVKRTDTTGDWQVYHRSNANTQYMVLNLNNSVATGATRWNSTTPTATEFSVGTDATVNASGGTYVAYLYAHNTASDGIIQCGSYVGNGSSTGPVITLGWEPQWILFKCINNSAYWYVLDNMRGMPVSGVQASLYPNAATNENGYSNMPILAPTATGFQLISSDSDFNGNGNTYIYVAIRRGPMRTPTLGTSVFSPVYATSASSPYTVTTNFPVDLVISTGVSGNSKNTMDRLRGGTTTSYAVVNTDSTVAEFTGSSVGIGFQNNTAVVDNSYWSGYGLNVIYWNFRRAPGFMDVVCYTGNGSNGVGDIGRTITHGLGVAPELVIVKNRSASTNWRVWTTPFGSSNNALLNSSGAPNSAFYVWANTYLAVTNPITQFGVYADGTSNSTNTSNQNYVAYLFASAPGVSKVGSYTGNGSSQTINCAFTTGARFVLIKRTDSTGDWYVWDSARGIVAGNDPYLALNTLAAEVTSNDSVDTDSTGFIVNQVAASNINVNAATYIFLAIA